MSEAAGFAVVERGRLLIETVAGRDVDAMQNWLANGLMLIPSGVPDGFIRRSFSQCAERKGAEVVSVLVTSGRRSSAPRRVESQPEAEEGEY